jgi:hypothetical protein
VHAHQEVPADILILEIETGKTHKPQTCMVRGSVWGNSAMPMPKRSFEGTSNRTGIAVSDSRFIDSISGALKWEYNHLGHFSGSFKQENSATASDLQAENVIQQGCYFTKAKQVIGLVLHVGDSTLASFENLRKPGTPEFVVHIKELARVTQNSVQGWRLRTLY